MRTTIIAMAAAIVAASAPAAFAMPAAKAAQAVEGVRSHSGTGIEKTDYSDRRRMLHKRHRHDRGIDWNDRRYSNYRGWHQYHSRPRGWRDRGCVAVGPIWFCK